MYLFTGVNKPQAYFSGPVCHVARMEYLKITLKLWSKKPKKNTTLNMLDCIEDNIKREVKEVGWEGVD